MLASLEEAQESVEAATSELASSSRQKEELGMRVDKAWAQLQEATAAAITTTTANESTLEVEVGEHTCLVSIWSFVSF